ncbi:hypothetical protein [Alkalicoccobacillus gibsonii]|jgi:hypothetical protein|uniref:Uncharacterized protein n=1 Tax=Alkalicoccobacillus gibsonii TaxID=79881 RepID=A0ABU9VEV7_9BACI|nr:hypothetical protein [Alkalicoccobacillus gibsonii]MBM0066903.1 hypothetical protein [Alkalicoccobacillus gibsonii]
MNTGKKIWITILFAIGGGAITGLVGSGVLFLIESIWPDGLIADLSVGTTFLVTVLPGIVASFYWSFFYIKKQKNETKHLDDHIPKNEQKF